MALNLLLVDDSPIVRAVVKKSVTAANLPLESIHEAGDGRSALDLLQAQWVDLVFADIHMPIMSGEQMIDQMQQDPLLRTIPVIVISTEGSTARMEQLIAKGVRAYLRKPVTPEQIRQVITEVVGFRLPRQEVDSSEQIVCNVLERMAFMFADPAAKAEIEPPQKALLAEMTFDGAFQGSITAAASPELCAEMAANILGHPLEENAQQDGATALKEVLNVVCGRLLTAMAGEEPVFQLSIPEAREADAEQWRALASAPSAMQFIVEDRPLLLRLVTDTPASVSEA